MSTRLRAKMLTDEEERAAVDRMLAGDARARDRLVVAYWPLIRKMSKNYSGVEREELESAALVEVIDRCHKFNPERGPFIGYVKYIAHECMKGMAILARKRRKMSRYLDEPPADNGRATKLDLVPSDAPSQEAEMIESEKSSIIENEIAQLPEREALVIRRRNDGTPLEEIGMEMGGIGKARVSQIHKRAVRRIKEKLAA